MNRKFCIGFLIVSFGLSTVNVGWAAEIVEVPPVIVQPADIQSLNKQTLNLDRKNRDQEIAIQDLINENEKLIENSSAMQQDETLQKMNQVMLSYRDALLLRDRGRIAALSQQPSKYHDLIVLTQSVQNMKELQGDIRSRGGLIEEKYQILNDLKNEMEALNAKLKGEGGLKESASVQKDAVIEGLKNIEQQQEDKIQTLVGRLSEMDRKIAHFDEIIGQKDQQIAILQDNLAKAQSEVSSKNEIIKELSRQPKPVMENKANEPMEISPIIVQPNVEYVRAQKSEVKVKPAVYNKTTDVLETAPIIVQPSDEQSAQKKLIQQQADSIVWLNKVLAAAKDKAEYYKVTSQQATLSTQQLQEEVGKVKADVALRFKDFNQYEKAVVSLKDQVNRSDVQLIQKQQQVASLKEELDRRIKAEQSDDRLELARQLINLHHQEEELLLEKSRLTLQQYTLFDGHLSSFENKVKILLTNRRTQMIDWQDRLETLKSALSQKQQEIDSLKVQLENKIAHQRNQEQLAAKIQDLRGQLQDQQDAIVKLTAKLQDSFGLRSETESLKAQLASQDRKAVLLKEELANKVAESNKMTALADDYQQKLESKDTAYNEQLQQAVFYKKYQADSAKQITDLNLRLQEKEAQVVRIKEDLYELQKHAMDKDRSVQTKDLSLSMLQQMMDKKTEEMKALRQELSLEHQRLAGMPSSDEIEFLRSGLEKATIQLAARTQELQSLKAFAAVKQQGTDARSKEIKDLRQELAFAKDRLQGMVKSEETGSLKNKLRGANAALAAQTKIFQKLKGRLQNSEMGLFKSKADLEDKTREIAQLKRLSQMSEQALRKEVSSLTHRLVLAEKKPANKMYDNQMMALELNLKSSLEKIKELKAQVKDMEAQPKDNVVKEKLTQALAKIQEQGALINTLSRKLEDVQGKINSLPQNQDTDKP